MFGCCNIRSQLVIERRSFAARENAFCLPAPKHYVNDASEKEYESLFSDLHAG
jgi:hypothetical protein